MACDRVICFGPERLRTRTSFYKPQCPSRIMTSFFSWSKAQRAAIKWYPSTWKPWSALLDCRLGEGTSCTRPALLRPAFLFFSYLFPLLLIQENLMPNHANHLLLPFLKKKKNTMTLNKIWNKKISQPKPLWVFFFDFLYLKPLRFEAAIIIADFENVSFFHLKLYRVFYTFS